MTFLLLSAIYVEKQCRFGFTKLAQFGIGTLSVFYTWAANCLQKVQGRKKKIDISVEKHVFGTLFGEKQLLCTVYILLNFQSEINLFSSKKIIFLVFFLNKKHIV